MTYTFWKRASRNSERPHPHAVATGKTLHPYLTGTQEASWDADEQCVHSTEEEVRHGG